MSKTAERYSEEDLIKAFNAAREYKDKYCFEDDPFKYSEANDYLKKNKNMETYIFHREGIFYPIELRDDDDAIKNAVHNVGTIKVYKIVNGEKVEIWSNDKKED